MHVLACGARPVRPESATQQLTVPGPPVGCVARYSLETPFDTCKRLDFVTLSTGEYDLTGVPTEGLSLRRAVERAPLVGPNSEVWGECSLICLDAGTRESANRLVVVQPAGLRGTATCALPSGPLSLHFDDAETDPPPGVAPTFLSQHGGSFGAWTGLDGRTSKKLWEYPCLSNPSP